MNIYATALALAVSLFMPGIQSSRAGSATWNLNPPRSYWNFATDWTPATVPNGPNDTATFRVSNTTDVIVEASNLFEVNGIVFDAGAGGFTITVFSDNFLNCFLTIGGTGITNNSGVIQNFVADFNASTQAVGVIKFINSATAGALTVFNNNESNTQFFDTASAGSGTFNNNPGHLYTGDTFFFDRATAKNATIISNGSLPGAPFLGGLTMFQNEAAPLIGMRVRKPFVPILNGGSNLRAHTMSHRRLTIERAEAKETLSSEIARSESTSYVENGNQFV